MYSALYILHYRVLSYFFYYLGDVASRIPTEWGYYLYQSSMAKSIKYDDVCGGGLWREPEDF